MLFTRVARQVSRKVSQVTSIWLHPYFTHITAATGTVALTTWAATGNNRFSNAVLQMRSWRDYNALVEVSAAMFDKTFAADIFRMSLTSWRNPKMPSQLPTAVAERHISVFTADDSLSCGGSAVHALVFNAEGECFMLLNRQLRNRNGREQVEAEPAGIGYENASTTAGYEAWQRSAAEQDIGMAMRTDDVQKLKKQGDITWRRYAAKLIETNYLRAFSHVAPKPYEKDGSHLDTAIREFIEESGEELAQHFLRCCDYKKIFTIRVTNDHGGKRERVPHFVFIAEFAEVAVGRNEVAGNEVIDAGYVPLEKISRNAQGILVARIAGEEVIVKTKDGVGELIECLHCISLRAHNAQEFQQLLERVRASMTETITNPLDFYASVPLIGSGFYPVIPSVEQLNTILDSNNSASVAP